MRKPYIVLTILTLLISCGGGKSAYQIEPPSTKPGNNSGSGNGGSGTTPTETVVKDPELPNNNAIARMKELGVGWNLGNNLDALPDGFSDSDDKYGWPDETCWSNAKATQQTFNKIKSYGFTYVRIPVTWAKLIGPAPDYTLDAQRLNRVEEVIGFAHNSGLRVVMDTHHDECWYLDLLEEMDERIAAGKISADKRDYYI